MNKLLIKGATIINEGERSLKDIYIEGEFIRKQKQALNLIMMLKSLMQMDLQQSQE